VFASHVLVLYLVFEIKFSLLGKEFLYDGLIGGALKSTIRFMSLFLPYKLHHGVTTPWSKNFMVLKGRPQYNVFGFRFSTAVNHTYMPVN